MNMSVIGGAGKLLKYFEQRYSPLKLVSYADRRWSTGKLYETLGFRLKNISKPCQWYFKNGSLVLQSRLRFQKHRLAKILDKYDPDKTEIENMFNNGYNMIYDCGNLVYVKDYSNVAS